ncbi:hypothetical protein NW768_008595 [Fusarium equiseti]|uniref:Uncharacterized protein n=1 Tax=Fusarium equiseti TaxID=61235 RepID=A0ABQ8R598_FUSEQ|nr:hypothetical protein NW768_008595 [Fusarium equiseti]
MSDRYYGDLQSQPGDVRAELAEANNDKEDTEAKAKMSEVYMTIKNMMQESKAKRDNQRGLEPTKNIQKIQHSLF